MVVDGAPSAPRCSVVGRRRTLHRTYGLVRAPIGAKEETMLEALAVRPRICQQLRSGPLGPWIDDFVDTLATRGYAPSVIRRYVRAAVIFSEWLERQRVRVPQIDEPLVSRFVSGRPRRRAPSRRPGRVSEVTSGVVCWPRISGPAVPRLAAPRCGHRPRLSSGAVVRRASRPCARRRGRNPADLSPLRRGLPCSVYGACGPRLGSGHRPHDCGVRTDPGQCRPRPFGADPSNVKLCVEFECTIHPVP